MATLQIRWSTGVRPTKIRPDQPTEFEKVIGELGLTSDAEMLSSRLLYNWVSHNRTKRYVPDWLLVRYGMQLCDHELYMN